MKCFSSNNNDLHDACKRPFFINTAAILNSNLSYSYYSLLRGKIHTNLPPSNPYELFEMMEFSIFAVSVKRSIIETDYSTSLETRGLPVTVSVV